MFSIFQLSTVSTPQIFPCAGGQADSLNIYIQFVAAPSAGTVSMEYQRPGSPVWNFLQAAQSVSVTTGAVSFKVDGGISALRVTFSGLIGGTSPVLSISPSGTATPPKDLLTDGGFGPSRRIRVDQGQTGLFAGKFFRSYTEQVIPIIGQAVSFRFTSPIDFILWSQTLTLTQGAIRFEVFAGAVTPSGTWSQLPVIGVNRMADRPLPLYAPQSTIEIGGSFTGGTAVDLMFVRCSTNQGNASSQNAGGATSERALPAGVYYGRFSILTGGVTVIDAAQMIYTLEWEERPVIT
jgi:hypothetical protein